MFETIFPTHISVGLLVLRVALAVIILAHGWPKMVTEGKFTGPGQLAGFLKSMNIPLPGFFAWVVALLETVGAVMLLLGLATRVLAVALVIDMLVAIIQARIKMGKSKFAGGGQIGWEFEFLLMAGAAVMFIAGPGLISLDRLIGLQSLTAPGAGSRSPGARHHDPRRAAALLHHAFFVLYRPN